MIITGGSRGIGAEMVKIFAEQGFRVAFTYLNSYEQAQTLSKEYGAFAIKADISDFNQTKAAIESAKKHLNGADILINNAGIAQSKLLCDISECDFHNMLNVNINGVFYATQAVLPDMISKKRGRIINISSVWGVCGASMETHYSASKAAVIGFTKALAKEVAPSQITVNCIAPGVIDTDMNKCYSDSEISALCEQIPLCHMGSVTDVAALALFLASNSASYITGQVIGVDGGFGV